MKVMVCGVVFSMILLLTSCTSDIASAPVVNGWHQSSAGQSDFYRVNRGDTLYSIAWAFGLDFRELAKINQLSPPYNIKVGQQLRMSTSPRVVARGNVSVPAETDMQRGPSLSDRSSAMRLKKAALRPSSRPTVSHSTVHLSHNAPVAQWRWPARGRVVARFSTSSVGNKGLDISGSWGEPVKAAANGVVVYSGAGVRGYGNLVIIKHNNSYLSAYAFNQRILVGLGQRVKVGQNIATMGKNNAGLTVLHFEIRRNGVPVDPLKYLA